MNWSGNIALILPLALANGLDVMRQPKGWKGLVRSIASGILSVNSAKRCLGQPDHQGDAPSQNEKGLLG
jgi:hypothetical protein